MSKLRVLSLFDGISCARVALGNRVLSYTASEIDASAIECSKQNWPETVHIGSVKNIKTSEYKGKVDLLIGGSPCQDLSSANPNPAGLVGEKSKLFWEYVRVLKEVKPKWFIFENVKSMSSAVKDEISKVLEVQPIMINASLFSAQSRKRLFWTNIPLSELPPSRNIKIKDILLAESALIKENPKYLDVSEITPIQRANNGEMIRVATYRGTYSSDHIYCVNGNFPTLRTTTYERVRLLDGRVRALVMTELERLQSLPDGYTLPMGSNTKRKHGIGNGFNVEVIRWIISHIP
jgi:site-specific DNA-cytosine methylase